ncbi:MAG: 4-hydroxy-tetrahydrodipicolinate reductase [Christensenellales bacterium]
MRVIICGVCGKMGQVLCTCAASLPDIQIVAGIDIAGNIRNYPFPVFETVDQCNVQADVYIDFSRPELLDSLLRHCSNLHCPVVIATTGFTNEQIDLMHEYGKIIPVFNSSNMSLGINLLLDLVRRAASFWGNGCDVEIIEKHHNQKVDSPSGTAYLLANAINSVYDNQKEYVYGRSPQSGKREKNEIGIHSIRGGTIIGEHQVLFISDNEIVEIKHYAQSRSILANGALRAAAFLSSCPPGFYTMEDLIVSS